jgi:hypothetical protein
MEGSSVKRVNMLQKVKRVSPSRVSFTEFLDKAKSVHGECYDYSKSEFTRMNVKVEIVCCKHNINFWQSPTKHVQGQGCPICRYEKTSRNNTNTLEEFLRKAVIIHGTKYNYDGVNYKTVHTPIEIYCKVHKSCFSQKPTNHLSGRGCQLCAKEKVTAHINSLILTTEEFIAKAEAVECHRGLYEYNYVVYTRSSGKVKIWCKQHEGFFEITANSHLRGVGCASCARTGYSPTKAGILYILKCGDITKIGITNILSSERASKISKSFGAEFQVIKEYKFEDGSIPDKLETLLLRSLKKTHKQPSTRFEGRSECFYDVDLPTLITQIETLIGELNGN